MNLFLIWLGKMSLQASAAVCAVFLIRLFFDRIRLPKKYSYILWTVPYLVMILPWKLKTSFSLWQGTPKEYVPVTMPDKRILASGGTYVMTDYREAVFPVRMLGRSDKALPFSAILLGVWLGGIVVLILWNLFLYWRLRRHLVCRIPMEDGIYVADDLTAPLVLGIFSPAVFLPSRMEPDMLPYVIAHERMHVRRRDPLMKTIAFLITCVHWFNPAAWMALGGLGQDMEMACDEGAVAGLGKEDVHNYAEALLLASAETGILSGAFLAFGDGSVKKRIKNILESKRSVRLAAVFAAAAILVLGAGFLTEAKELPGTQSIANTLEKILPGLQESFVSITDSVSTEAPEEYAVRHRDRYEETVLHLYIPQSAKDSGYVTEGRWSGEQLEALARSAMQELYDLTGTQIEECFYFAYDHSYFVFGMTEDDLERGRSFYCRQFEDGNIIQGIDMASARRVWYSPVDMMILPDGHETMTEADLAAWFVVHSGSYNGREVSQVYQPYEWDPHIWRVVMDDDTAYEVMMDPKVNSFSNIVGPYPNSDIQH